MSRRTAREDALRLVFQRELDPDSTPLDYYAHIDCEERQQLFATPAPSPKELGYISRVVEGTLQETNKLEAILEQHASNRSIERMGGVCRAILKIALFEMMFCDEIPRNVSINEAIELAKIYDSAETAGFVNGILDKIMKEG